MIGHFDLFKNYYIRNSFLKAQVCRIDREFMNLCNDMLANIMWLITNQSNTLYQETFCNKQTWQQTKLSKNLIIQELSLNLFPNNIWFVQNYAKYQLRPSPQDAFSGLIHCQAGRCVYWVAAEPTKAATASYTVTVSGLLCTLALLLFPALLVVLTAACFTLCDVTYVKTNVRTFWNQNIDFMQKILLLCMKSRVTVWQILFLPNKSLKRWQTMNK